MINLNIYCDEHDFSNLEKAFLNEFLSDIPLACEVVFCDEEEIKNLNFQTRNINSVTDVLSYPTLSVGVGEDIKGADYPYDIDEEGKLFIGSIVICVKRAKEQAEEFGHSYERELYYLATHGVCHLLGYDHMEEGDKALMREKEEKVLSKINIKRQ
ncbi:MAG: rRNA maturation RNase YbeY [Clostridia bacterium]|nr:rRNA maturation RNase YbeY [Clostridia bacterium]